MPCIGCRIISSKIDLSVSSPHHKIQYQPDNKDNEKYSEAHSGFENVTYSLTGSSEHQDENNGSKQGKVLVFHWIGFYFDAFKHFSRQTTFLFNDKGFLSG